MPGQQLRHLLPGLDGSSAIPDTATAFALKVFYLKDGRGRVVLLGSHSLFSSPFDQTLPLGSSVVTTSTRLDLLLEELVERSHTLHIAMVFSKREDCYVYDDGYRRCFHDGFWYTDVRAPPPYPSTYHPLTPLRKA